MKDHDHEERHVEIGQEMVESADQAPRQRHEHVRGVVDLARVAPPAIDEQLGPGLGVQVARVFESAPR